MRFRKIEEGIENLSSSSDGALSKICRQIKELFNSAIDHILFFLRSPIVLIVAVVLVVLTIALYVVGIVALNGYFNSDELTCLGDFDLDNDDKLKIVPAVPESYNVKGTYSYEKTTQKSDFKDFGIKSNYDYKKINITGIWIPWFGDEIMKIKNSNQKDRSFLDIDTPDHKFICNMYKKMPEIDKDGRKNYYFGETDIENEFYYIKNYYSDVNIIDSKNGLKYQILNSNEQQQCWLNRGMGLYMGFFGRDGKSQPQHLHHLVANKAVCETPYFIPESHVSGVSNLVNENYVIATNNTYSYRVSDFLSEFFSVSYYLDRDYNYCDLLCNNGQDIGNIKDEKCDAGGFCEEVLKNNKSKIKAVTSEEKNILNIGMIDTIYDIKLHEDLLYKYGVRDPGLVIANSTSMFNQACYNDKTIISKSDKDNEQDKIKTTRTFVGKFRFEETENNRLFKKYAENNNGKNVEYDFGEIIKFIILDRYYEDNQGSYKLEFLNGFNVKESKGLIETFLTTVEKFMLGTSEPDSNTDRKDGIMFKLYNSIVNDITRNLARALLALYVIINGFMIMLGYKKVDMKNLMIFCFKIALLFAFLSKDAWALFNKTFINFLVNGTIGIIDLIYDVFSRVFVNFDITNNSIFNYNITSSGTELYLSKNFKFLDNIFYFLFSKEVHLKILSILFTFPIIGIIPVIFIYYLLFKYVLILLGTVIPYLKTLLQLTIVIGLAPIFILFMFFETTNGYFKSWLNYLVSRMFELIVFFFVLFFACGLINNKFLDLLGYEICKENVSELLKNTMGL